MVVSVVTRGRSDDANGYVVDNSAQLAGAESASTSAQLAGAESASTSAQLAGAESASNSVWLRIARVGEAYACHASIDGTRWDFVRHFTLGTTAAAIGFEVQSPLGEGCRAAFTDITFSPTTLTNLRDGS
ncbi:MAG: DUF1349 domain-containing protein [Micromonosporaceae bacterium]|nr:DUF1349 domain-containing protein [Micromonosporaceae bacterium]